ncbi:MAG: cation:proton antiporter [Lachnospiraceae bacterium]|nr:cation:proton antiporter [Lachnospiraceae bacterium]
MLFSISIILLSGMLFGWLCKAIGFPTLFGMIIAGIIIGPGCLNLIDASMLSVSGEIRRLALIIILIRAGLKLDLSDLKKVGRPAILMCFLPACFEIAGMVLLAPRFLEMNILDAAILGAVIGAVSPAVIVPRMIRLIDEGYGTKEGIPQMILAGASVDDVVVIVLFTTFTGLAKGKGVSVMAFVNIPLSIVIGIASGLLIGWVLIKWFSNVKLTVTVMGILFLAVSLLVSTVETKFPMVPFASLIAIMCMGIAFKKKDGVLAGKLSSLYDKMWTVAEIFLFVLVGASVAVSYLKKAGPAAVLLILLVLLFRMAGVWICVLKTGLNKKEKTFCMLAYTPKATVQAAIGGVPLAMGLSCGELVLTVSVVAILLTAPLGAFAIDATYKKSLSHEGR